MARRGLDAGQPEGLTDGFTTPMKEDVLCRPIYNDLAKSTNDLFEGTSSDTIY